MEPPLHPFAALPEELCLRIFSFLSAADLLSIALLCSDMHRLASDNSLWEALCACNFLPSPTNDTNSVKQWFGRIVRSSVLVDRKYRDERKPQYVPMRVFASIEKYLVYERFLSSRALREVKPADSFILVRSGTYQEHITLSKPVQIIAAGPKGSVVLKSYNRFVTVLSSVAGPGSALRNFTVQQVSTGQTSKPCILISKGGLLLAGCDIWSTSTKCAVEITGEDTNPTVVGNSFIGCASSAIYVSGGSTGLVERNTITQCEKAGITIASYANPRVVGNTISEGRKSGILVSSRGKGIIDGNCLFRNAHANLEIKSASSHPLVVNNHIYDGLAIGVYVHDFALATLEGNTIYGNAKANVRITGNAAPHLLRNKIHSGKHCGVYIRGGSAVLSNNAIFGNALYGVLIATSGDTLVTGNEISRSGRAGISVRKEGHPILEENYIHSNTGAGLEIFGAANPSVLRNRICNGKSVGVHVGEEGRGVVKDNDITGNAKVGVAVNSGALPTFIGNRITNGQSAGVLVHDNGGGTFVGNEVSRNAMGGFVIKAKCNPTLVQNSVHDSSYFGIHVSEGALGVIKENSISGNKQAGIVIKAGARPIVQQNQISKEDIGIYLESHAGGVVADNDIRNSPHALVIHRGAEASVSANRFS